MSLAASISRTDLPRGTDRRLDYLSKARSVTSMGLLRQNEHCVITSAWAGSTADMPPVRTALEIKMCGIGQRCAVVAGLTADANRVGEKLAGQLPTSI